MFRNTLFIALFTFTLLTPKVSTAHLAGYVNIGYWLHVASLECGGDYDQHGALKEGWELDCNATILKYQGQCVNPQGKTVDGTPSKTQTYELTGSSENEREFEKEKGNGGRATASAHLITDGLPLECKQKNYIPLVDSIVVLQFIARQTTRECLNEDCTATSTAWTKEELCTLPEEYDFDNPPPVGTPFNCTVIEETHLN